MVGAGSVPSLDTSTKHTQEFKTPSYLFLLTHAMNLWWILFTIWSISCSLGLTRRLYGPSTCPMWSSPR